MSILRLSSSYKIFFLAALLFASVSIHKKSSPFFNFFFHIKSQQTRRYSKPNRRIAWPSVRTSSFITTRKTFARENCFFFNGRWNKVKRRLIFVSIVFEALACFEASNEFILIELSRQCSNIVTWYLIDKR